MVYQEEVAIENSNENTLTTNNMVINYDSIVEDVNIPTITYACNEKYGINGSRTYEPVVSEVINGRRHYYKHAYYVGTSNGIPVTLPVNLDTKPSGRAWQIDENNPLSSLFDFPIIDKVLNIEYICWAFMDDIPYYKKVISYANKDDITETITIEEYDSLSEDDKENYKPVYDTRTVTMNGSLGANIFNGNIVNDEFDEQSLCSMRLKISQNLLNSQETYVEKRIILGYKDDEVLDGMLGFTNYIVDENYTEDITQYAPVLLMETELILEDEQGCGIRETIYGSMKIELTENSVNNCITGEKILEVQAVNADEPIYYSTITLENGAIYPLNYAEKSGIEELCILNNEIKDPYSVGKEYNLFSYKMTSDCFRDGDNRIVDMDFLSSVREMQDDGSYSNSYTLGYGTTGHFESGEYVPVYIVAETENHCRAISPVYDYSYVGALIKFGKLYRKDVEITTGGGGSSEGGEGGGNTEGGGTDSGGSGSGESGGNSSGKPTYKVLEPIEDFKFGIAVKKGHYYLDNYKYRMYGVCRLDSVNVIEVREDTMNDSGQFLFATITEVVYKILKSKMKSGIFTKIQLIGNTEVTAIDYTGLKHICGINIEDLENAETEWYTYLWFANMPMDENNEPYPASIENGGIFYKNEYIDYIEFVYEKDELIDPMVCWPGEVLGYEFLGWTENEPNDAGPFIDFSSEDNRKVTECRIYFGNWKVPAPKITVHFMDADETTELDSVQVNQGEKVLPSQEMSQYNWYLKGDTTQTPINFGTEGYGPINEETWFIRIAEYEVDWVDNNDILPPPTFMVYFRNSEESSVNIDTQEVIIGQTVTPRGDCANHKWYLQGDSTMTNVEFPYVITQETTFLYTYIFTSVNVPQQTVENDVTLLEMPIISSLNNEMQNFTKEITSGGDWLSISSDSIIDTEHKKETLRLIMTQNSTENARTATILLKQTGSNKTVTLTIVQNPAQARLKWRLNVNLGEGDAIQSITITFNNNVVISAGGGINPQGGYRESSQILPDELRDTPLEIQSITMSPSYSDYEISQVPKPYVWSGNGGHGNVPLIITLTK